MRRAGFFGHHPPRDKEHHLASRKCRRESTPQTPPLSQLLRSGGGEADPVARTAPKPKFAAPDSSATTTPVLRPIGLQTAGNPPKPNQYGRHKPPDMVSAAPKTLINADAKY
jgi:hypothetical protein